MHQTSVPVLSNKYFFQTNHLKHTAFRAIAKK